MMDVRACQLYPAKAHTSNQRCDLGKTSPGVFGAALVDTRINVPAVLMRESGIAGVERGKTLGVGTRRVLDNRRRGAIAGLALAHRGDPVIIIAISATTEYESEGDVC